MPPSNVEATIFILDIGCDLKEDGSGTKFFRDACDCIVRILERKIFSRPDDLVALILMGTNESNNNLAQDGMYSHISIATPLDKAEWKLIRILQDKIHPTDVKADWFDSLIVAVDFLNSEVSGKKISQKKIALLSDLSKEPATDEETLQKFVDGFKDDNIELNIIGPEIELDDDEEDDKHAVKLEKTKSETVAIKLVSDTNGIICSFEDAMSHLMFFKRKAVSPWSWNVDLTIGTDIKIPISAFCRIKADKSLKEWKRAYKEPASGTISSNCTFEKISKRIKENDNTYVVNEVDIIEGYLYGQTLVPFTDFDKTMNYVSGPKCLSIYGFTKKENVTWNDLSGDGLSYVSGRKNNEVAQIAVSALATAMDDLGLVAIARRVYNNNNLPTMFAIFPIIEDDYRCLSMGAIFYKEDYKYMKFPPLNKAISDEQTSAMDSLIDSMDLNSIEDDKDVELFKVGSQPNPSVQYVFDCIAYKALNPDKPLPKPRLEVKALLEVPLLVKQRSEEPLKIIKELFPLVVKEKVKVERKIRPKVDEINGDMKIEHNELNGQMKEELKDEVVSQPSQVTSIGTLNPVEDLRQMLAQGEPFEIVSEQVIDVIERLLFISLRDETEKILKLMGAFREECVRSNAGIYNTWMETFKVILLERNKRDFFETVVTNKLSLITMTENSDSTISDNRANLFADLESLNDQAIKESFADEDDLFGDSF